MKISTLKLSALLAFLFSASMSMAQTITTVGIIGSATPFTATNPTGWDASTPMTRVTAGGNDWVITLPLKVGAVKFRANDAWTINWGGTGLSGTGTQGGPDIPITTAGTYTARINDITGVYSITVAASSKSSNDAILKLALAPNPANGAVRVAYELPTAGTASIEVQNLLGQRVQKLAPVFQAAGAREQQVSLSGMAAGIYLVQLKTADLTQTTRLVVE